MEGLVANLTNDLIYHYFGNGSTYFGSLNKALPYDLMKKASRYLGG